VKDSIAIVGNDPATAVVYHVHFEGKPYAELGAGYLDRVRTDRTQEHVS
jgi:hypothetical protein